MKNKLLMGVIAIVVSCALWMYVSLVVSPESEATYENIPVVLDGTATLESKNLMIVSDTNLRVDLLLVGNRQDLNKLNSANITILADLSHITQAGEHNVKYNIFYPGTVQSGTIEAQEKNPQYITVVVVEREEKTIPVEVDYLGSVPENFIAQDATLDHATITVSGPKEEIDRIDHARISVELTGRTTDIVGSYRYTLCDAKGSSIENSGHITASASEIRSTVKINQIKKLKLVYDIIPGGGIDASKVTVTPVEEAHTWITVSGSQSVLASLEGIYLGAIDLSKQTQSGRVTFSIEMPEGVENFSGFWTVSYDVEIPVLEIRQFSVNKANCILVNVPEDILIEFKFEERDVWLRGPAEVLDQLSAENIRAIVDYDAQGTIKLNNNNQLRVSFIIVDAEGNEITEVGAVTPPGAENYVYTVFAHVSMQEESPVE